MGGCAVLGCHNRFVRRGKHFYRFPKDDERRQAWIKFTRKCNYEPKGSSTICEVHFTKECFVKKKDRLHLSKDAVPQIYYKNTNLGLEMEMVNVQYDSEKQTYVGLDSKDVFRGNLSVEDVEAISNKRHERVDELKSLCRFCFYAGANNEAKCVSISMLDAYHINIEELGLKLLPEELCGDLVCEQCFHQIVEIDLFKKKCREAQEDILTEIAELDARIQEVQEAKINGQTWHKAAIGSARVETPTIEFLEEHLVEDEEFDNYHFEPQLNNQEEEYIEEIHEGFKIVYQQLPEASSTDINLEFPDAEFSTEDPCNIQTLIEPKQAAKLALCGVDEYAVDSTDDIIKNPERNRFCFRIYECFFCKMKFAGRKTYVAHKCPVTNVQCTQCDKVFSKIQAYNSHVSHIHGSLPISKHFCPLCKTVIMSTVNQFKQHRRLCNKKTRNQPIECEVCGKLCVSLKGYTIHKLFHDTRNFTTSTGEKIVTEGLNKGQGVAICELCGKDFNSSVGYRMHKRNVHRVGQAEGESFQCDVCSKICPTKRSLFDHMRNTHRVQETPCNVCSKVFRTKVLLKKHMMYHDETKRVFRCNLCPEKPGYFTNVALKRHQRSHQGSRDFHCNVKSCHAAYTTNHQLKIHKLNKHALEANRIKLKFK